MACPCRRCGRIPRARPSGAVRGDEHRRPCKEEDRCRPRGLHGRAHGATACWTPTAGARRVPRPSPASTQRAPRPHRRPWRAARASALWQPTQMTRRRRAARRAPRERWRLGALRRPRRNRVPSRRLGACIRIWRQIASNQRDVQQIISHDRCFRFPNGRKISSSCTDTLRLPLLWIIQKDGCA